MAALARAQSSRAGAQQELQDLMAGRLQQIAQELIETRQMIRETRERIRTGASLNNETQRIAGLLPGSLAKRGPTILVRDGQRRPVGEDDAVHPGDLLVVPSIDPDAGRQP